MNHISMGEIVLEGIVGSTAYGLAREGSDEDRLGVYCAPLDSLLRFSQPPESIQRHNPDVAYHEIKKYMSLAMKCNPTVTELMWLSDELYTVRKAWGNLLIGLREEFLSESLVRSAYGKYALKQAKRLQARSDDGRLALDDPEKIAKHARHCIRLMQQGLELLTTGKLTVRVSNPEYFWAMDSWSTEQILHEFGKYDRTMKNSNSALPERPNLEKIEKTLLYIRKWGVTPEGVL